MRLVPATQRKFHKQFIGDSTFDLEREQYRHRLFLNRNVMRTLAHHEKRQAKIRAASASKNPPNGLLQQNSKLEPGKEDLTTALPPKRGGLRSLQPQYSQEDAELVLELKNIRKKLNFNSKSPEEEERPSKRVRFEPENCQCHVAIWDNREGFISPEPIVKRSQFCSVSTRDSPSSGRVVDIQMDSPFIIKAKELLVPVKVNGAMRLAIGDKYFLETKIIPYRSLPNWPPFPILSKSEGATIEDVAKSSIANIDGVLVSSYANLPHAPASGAPLSVSFVQDGRTFKSKYGMEVFSIWTHPSTYESKFKVNREHLPDQQPWWIHPPDNENSNQQPPSQESEGSSTIHVNGWSKSVTPPPKVKVSYIWDVAASKQISKEFRTATVEGFSCAVCRRKEFNSLKGLQFHLINNHHRYQVKVESEEKDPVSGEMIRVTLRVEFAEIIRQKASNHVRDEREMDWEAPKRPFDVDAYITGDHTWVGVRPRYKGIGNSSSSKDSFPQSRDTAIRKSGFLPADQVAEIPPPQRKRHIVVRSRTRYKVPLFRSISHRPIRIDESPLSESDDDIDNSWLRQRHSEMIAEQEDLTEAQKEFRQRYDLHMMAESCPSGRYVSDSTVRFVRANKIWLRNAAILYEFNQLLQTFKQHGLIDDRVILGCARIIWSDDNADGNTMMVGSGDRSTTNRNGEIADSNFTTKSNTSTTLETATQGACGVCSNNILRKKSIIVCSNPNCNTPGVTYHLACIGRTDRDGDWLCPRCAEDSLSLKSSDG